jgi:hypothetical protein
MFRILSAQTGIGEAYKVRPGYTLRIIRNM